MWSWIVTAVLYLLGMGIFALLGGLRAAGEAIRRWGEWASHREQRPSPSA